MRSARFIAILGCTLATQACFFKKQPRVFTLPPVAAKPTLPAPQPIEVPDAPTAEINVDPNVDPTVRGDAKLPPAPPKPQPAKPKPAKPATAVVPPQIVPPADAPTLPPTPPKPATILSANERRALTQDLDARLTRVRAALARLQGRSVSAQVTALANDTRSFLQQAEQARAQDLVTAVNLAKRAEIFAADLVQRLP
jgi:hypothetical protein